jgi:hypothetical protein
MSTIFLSHSSRDNFEAVALRDWLAREGWDDAMEAGPRVVRRADRGAGEVSGTSPSPRE